MLSKYFKDLLCQLTKVPFFATQLCRATSSHQEPFHVSRVCTGGFCSHGGCPHHLTAHFCHPPGFPSAPHTRFKLLSVTHIVICTVVSWLLAFLHIPFWCFWSHGRLSAADCLYHTFRLLSGLVTKMQLTEFNPTLIPNHTSQGPKLLAEERALWQGPKICVEEKQWQTWYGAKDDNPTGLVGRNGET